MNYPKPAPISKLVPAAVAAPGYHYVPQYSGMTFEVKMPQRSNLVLDDDENEGPLFFGRSGWKRTVLIILIGALAVIILPQIIRMINRRK